VDCFRCPEHPGAPPSDFWGTDPQDNNQVPTADELEIPWPSVSEEPGLEPRGHGRGTSVEPVDSLSLPEGPSRPRTQPRRAGHRRTISDESLDPLQADEDPGRVDAESSLAQDLNQLAIQDELDQWDAEEGFYQSDAENVGDESVEDDSESCYVIAWLVDGGASFADVEGNEVFVEFENWTESFKEYEGEAVPCYVYFDQVTNVEYYTWEFSVAGGSSGNKGKNKDKDKDKDKGKGKGKAKDKGKGKGKDKDHKSIRGNPGKKKNRLAA